MHHNLVHLRRDGNTHLWSCDGEQEEAGGNRPHGKRLEAAKERAIGREDELAVRGGCEEGKAPPRSRGVARSLVGTAPPKQHAETLPSSPKRPTCPRVPETLPPPPPAPAASPITSPRAPPPSPPPPAPPGRFRLESVSESQASPRKFPLAAPPLLAPPRPVLVLHPRVPSCAAELGQCKVISGRERARLLSGRAVARPPLAQHPPSLTLSGRPELVLSSCPHLFCISRGTIAREIKSARLDFRRQIYAGDRS